MRANHKSWSDHEIRILIAMSREGATQTEIAATIGRSLSAVVSKVSSLKSTINKQPDPVAPVYAPRAGLSRAERLTAGFFGDPPLGRSALDQREQR